jgi:hypothetical protein
MLDSIYEAEIQAIRDEFADVLDDFDYQFDAEARHIAACHNAVVPDFDEFDEIDAAFASTFNCQEA